MYADGKIWSTERKVNTNDIDAGVACEHVVETTQQLSNLHFEVSKWNRK